MPYITQEARERLQDGAYPETVGELNYLITRALQSITPAIKYYLGSRPVRYQAYNDVFGAMFGACLELIRREFPSYAAYESEKVIENGDVYDIKEEL